MGQESGENYIMKKQRRFLQAGIFGWILLPFIALVFSAVREIVVSRYFGNQPDSWLVLLPGIVLFYWLTYFFLRSFKGKYYTINLWQLGFIWGSLAVIFSTLIAVYFYATPLEVVIQKYAFWQHEPWPWVVVAIIVAPRLVSLILRRH